MINFKEQPPVVLKPKNFYGHEQLKPIVVQAATYIDPREGVRKWRLTWAHTNTQRDAIIGEATSLNEAATRLRRGIVTRYDPFHLLQTGQLSGHHSLSPANYREYRVLADYICEKSVKDTGMLNTVLKRFIQKPFSTTARQIKSWRWGH